MKFPASNSTQPIIGDPSGGAAQECLDGFGGLNVADCAARAEILHRAYSIWESKGRPEGSHLADCLEAQAEVSEQAP
jgi:hypothetical protein